jgi:hypothetical protein
MLKSAPADAAWTAKGVSMAMEQKTAVKTKVRTKEFALEIVIFTMHVSYNLQTKNQNLLVGKEVVVAEE